MSDGRFTQFLAKVNPAPSLKKLGRKLRLSKSSSSSSSLGNKSSSATPSPTLSATPTYSHHTSSETTVYSNYVVDLSPVALDTNAINEPTTAASTASSEQEAAELLSSPSPSSTTTSADTALTMSTLSLDPTLTDKPLLRPHTNPLSHPPESPRDDPPQTQEDITVPVPDLADIVTQFQRHRSISGQPKIIDGYCQRISQLDPRATYSPAKLAKTVKRYQAVKQRTKANSRQVDAYCYLHKHRGVVVTPSIAQVLNQDKGQVRFSVKYRSDVDRVIIVRQPALKCL
ncbi:hypothetical protein H4R33_000199 [Dimargaris cristalligena]|uniref:Uncharacterized protein n=1 Tax=Dimargaris cristalligena TaxID=215637 RepID=A0A4P9ZRL6_9FUNG|nr:hypothetical protein H4R33_000199 [Dimargaris cristalligena]RKP36005.1 hypothetical protein BJ085DRAFT_40564 [Dimargaris cristalligena]|eukprot:RKP36005.1 hypothetical protein BJ085DRAFT_40564 [Dimargaris cristalligena]